MPSPALALVGRPLLVLGLDETTLDPQRAVGAQRYDRAGPGDILGQIALGPPVDGGDILGQAVELGPDVLGSVLAMLGDERIVPG